MAAHTDLVVGGMPRVDLLPPEVRRRQTDRVVARWVVISVLLAVVVVAGCYVYGLFLAGQSLSALDRAIVRTQELAAEQQRFAEVSDLERRLEDAEAAQRVGAATRADWQGLVTGVAGALPGGARLTSVSAQIASPIAAYEQPAAPLQSERIGILQVSAGSATLPDVSAWIDALAELPGIADVVPGATIEVEGGGYETALTLHLDETVIVNPYAEEEAE